MKYNYHKFIHNIYGQNQNMDYTINGTQTYYTERVLFYVHHYCGIQLCFTWSVSVINMLVVKELYNSQQMWQVKYPQALMYGKYEVCFC